MIYILHKSVKTQLSLVLIAGSTQDKKQDQDSTGVSKNHVILSLNVYLFIKFAEKSKYLKYSYSIFPTIKNIARKTRWLQLLNYRFNSGSKLSENWIRPKKNWDPDPQHYAKTALLGGTVTSPN